LRGTSFVGPRGRRQPEEFRMKSKSVRIFVDFYNLTLAWERQTKTKWRDMDWANLPKLIMRRLDEKEFVDIESTDLRGITVYASTHPEPKEHDKQLEHWLRFGLDQMAGYTVKTCVRQRTQCNHDKYEPHVHFVEKGVDTMLVCDMLSLAMRGSYDIGVVISDDSDLVPSIQSVQDVLDRQIVHVGFKDESRGLVRSVAWAHLLLDDLRQDLRLRRQDNGPRTAIANALQSLVSRNDNDADHKKRGRRRRRPARSVDQSQSDASAEKT
jgi:uncharacterized LabA/DUF88 family protein